MADTRKLQLEAEVNDNTRAGFESIKQGAADMAQGVAQSSQAAGKAVDGIANGTGTGAQKFDGATRSIIGSIERATAAMQAGEKGSAKYFEALAGQRGANLDALKPYLEQLRQAEVAQQVANASLNGMGNTAKQTAAALRMVPFGPVYDQAKASGFTLAQLNAILGYPADTLEAFARANNLPVFHSGTNYVPETGFALLERGEAVIPKQYNSAAGPGYTPPPSDALATRETMDRLIAEVRGLRAQVAENTRHAANTSRAVNGSPDAPMIVEIA